MNEGLLAMGSSYEVSDVDFYKRAVIKAAPTCFTIEVLPPMKQGKAYSYGVRIIPLNARALDLTGDHESDTSSVNTLYREYDIWRRWDDCLDFQSKIESEYERISREKKRILVAGKQGKKNSGGDSPGLYKNATAAASFESLPEGPDPKSIKVDVHAYIPKLTRKSSFFSVSDAMVQKRAEEFAAMVYALFKSDCPKLIMELRDSETIRDFFAWWRRDQELMEKSSPDRRPRSAMSFSTTSRTARSSFSESSGWPSPSPSPLPDSPVSPGFSILKATPRPDIHPQRSPTEMSMRSGDVPKTPQKSDKTPVSPAVSPDSDTSRFWSPTRRVPGRNGQLPISRPILQSQEMGLFSPTANAPRPPAQGLHRGGRVFNPSDVNQLRISQGSGDASSDSSSPPTTPTRQGFDGQEHRPLSTVSIDSADYDIDLSFIKLPPPPPGRRNERDSVMSVASVDSTRTTDSMDAVIPRDRQRMSLRARRRRDGPWEPDTRLSIAVPEEDEVGLSDEEAALDDSMSYLGDLDMFPDIPDEGGQEAEYRSSFRTSNDARTPRISFPSSIAESEHFNDAPPSPTSTIMPSDSGHSMLSVTTASSELPPGICSVKAKYDDCIIALRLPWETSLAVVRARLVDKLVQVQGVQLPPNFSLAYTPAGTGRANLVPIILSPMSFDNPDPWSRGRRKPSIDSTHSHHAGSLTCLVPIWNQEDWELALESCHGKVVLHVLDSEFY